MNINCTFRRKGLLSAALFLSSLLSFADAESLPGLDERHEQGRDLYNYRCYYCHGYSGDARTLAASMMDPSPEDFTAILESEDHQHESDDEMRAHFVEAVTHGKDGTAMKSFTYYLNDEEIATVVDFIIEEFVYRKAENTRYHTVENGWPNHEQYKLAFPFATGEIAMDSSQEDFTLEQRVGYNLYLTSCISCHDWGRVEEPELTWRARSISFPRNNFSFTEFEEVDATTSASVFASHDQPVAFTPSTESAQRGKELFFENCAFCHGKDGTGKNWIGAFLDRAPRDLTDPSFISVVTPQALTIMIENGLVNSSMPAWKFVMDDQQIADVVAFVYENAAAYDGQK